MPLTPTSNLAYSSQDWKLRCELSTPRHFALSDVDGFGADQGAAPSDVGDPVPLDAAFDQISSLGTIGGSIAAGGWSATLAIPQAQANWSDFFGVALYLQTWYGGVPGVVGAAGIADEVRIFRGYQTKAQVEKVFQGTTSTFTVQSSTAFLQQAQFSRGIDWAAGLPHGAPGSANAIIDHLLRYHTNYGDRADIGIYVPDHELVSFSLNEGNVMGMIKSLVDNFCLEGLVYARREDDLFVGAHPNLVPDLHPNIGDPILDLTDDIVLKWEIGQASGDQCAQVTVVAQRSDQTEYIARYYGNGGIGSRDKYQIKTDSTAWTDTLAARMFAHKNRRYKDVKVTVPLNVAVDLGDVVTITADFPQRGIGWSGKKFFCTAVDYQPDFARRTWTGTLTLDEILEGY